MKSRAVFRGIFWSLIGLLLVAHVGGGWYYSSRLIEQGFVPDPDEILTPSGSYDLVEVSYDSPPLGEMQAYHLPADGSTWVIHVHGLGATPSEAEFLFSPLQEAGYPQLSIAYRNDEDHPEDPSGYHRFGETEFEDVGAAMRYASTNGAESVVFSGLSTGNSHILSFSYKNNLDDIKGIMMDSPNIDMGDTVDFRGSIEDLPILPFNVPPTVTWFAKFFTSLRIDVNWKAIDYVGRAEGSLSVPVLIHHGLDDESVPLSQSVEFQEASPDLVRLIAVPGAGHVESYDVDPEKYIEEVLRFLEEVG